MKSEMVMSRYLPSPPRSTIEGVPLLSRDEPILYHYTHLFFSNVTDFLFCRWAFSGMVHHTIPAVVNRQPASGSINTGSFAMRVTGRTRYKYLPPIGTSRHPHMMSDHWQEECKFSA